MAVLYFHHLEFILSDSQSVLFFTCGRGERDNDFVYTQAGSGRLLTGLATQDWSNRLDSEHERAS